MMSKIKWMIGVLVVFAIVVNVTNWVVKKYVSTQLPHTLLYIEIPCIIAMVAIIVFLCHKQIVNANVRAAAIEKQLCHEADLLAAVDKE